MYSNKQIKFENDRKQHEFLSDEEINSIRNEAVQLKAKLESQGNFVSCLYYLINK